MTEGHHLVLGTLTDRVTGRTLPDTHDERYRQKVAGYLLDVCRFETHEIKASQRVDVVAGGKKAWFYVDFLVYIQGHAAMVVRYGPGSIVTRHRPAQALCLVLAPHEIPVAVVTNGEDADVLYGGSGVVAGHGFESIPTRRGLVKILAESNMVFVSEKRREMAGRLLYAYEVDGSCPCDTSICKPGSEV